MLLYDRLLQVFKAQKEEFMLVYDANANSGSTAGFECTYTTFKSDNSTASPENPILVLDNSEKKWDETSYGLFTNPYKKTAFDFQINGESFTSNILKIDSRFTSLIKWLGENRVKVKLTGANSSEGYNVYKIQEVAFGNGNKLSAEDGFLQFMIERLLDLTYDITVCEFKHPRSQSAKLLAGDYPVKIEPDFRKALDDIYLQEGTFLITGSLYFISEVRKYLLQKIHSK